MDTIVERCTESESGARNIQTILNRTLLPELSGIVLSRMAEGLAVSNMHVGIGDDGGFTYRCGDEEAAG